MICVDDVIPLVHIALSGSVVTDDDIIETIADVRVVEVSLEWNNENTRLRVALCGRVEAMWDLSDELRCPPRVIQIPVPIVAILAPRVPHENHPVLDSISVSHREDRKDRISMLPSNAARIERLVVLACCTSQHDVVSRIRVDQSLPHLVFLCSSCLEILTRVCE